MPDDIGAGIDLGIDQETVAPAAADGGGGGGGTAMDPLRLEIAEVFDGVQVGIEARPGSAATVYRRLRSMKLMLQPHFQITPVESNGYVVPTDLVAGKEWSDIDISGELAFNELIFLLSSRGCVPTVTPDNVQPSVMYWDFLFASRQPSQIQTFNIQEGQVSSSSAAPGSFVNSLDFSIDDKSIKVSGKGMGMQLTDALGLTPGAVDVPQVMATAALVDVFMATTEGGLAAGQIDRGLGAKLSLPDARGSLMTLDSRTSSYSATPQKGGQPTGSIIVEKNSDAAAYLTTLRARQLGFTRIVMTGPEIGATGINYGAQWTYPYKYKDSKRSAVQDTSAATFDQQIIDNAAFGGYLKVRVTTDYTLAASGLFPAGEMDGLPFTGTNAITDGHQSEIWDTINNVAIATQENGGAMTNGWTAAATLVDGVPTTFNVTYPAGASLIGLEYRLNLTVGGGAANYFSGPLTRS